MGSWTCSPYAGRTERLACPLLGEEEEAEPALAAGCPVVHDVDEGQVVRVDGDADFFAGLADGAVGH